MSAHFARTGLQQAIDDAIANLVAARLDTICHAVVDETDPDHLRALSGLAAKLATKLDPLFFAIVVEGGLATAAVPDGHETYVTDAVAGNLDWSLTHAAEEIEESAGARSDFAEHNTLNHRQQF
jgi:hypothetical protein